MQCLFYRNDICYANPQIPALLGKYQPEKEVVEKYCKTENFVTCPRLDATLAYLKAINGK